MGEVFPEGFEESHSEVILVPGETLVDRCSFMDVEAVILLQVRVLLTEVGQDCTALSNYKISIN